MGGISLKTNYSGYHIRGAAFFARSVAQIEHDLRPPLKGETGIQYFSSITASVLMSVATLESKINEVYLFAVDRNPHVFKGVETWVIDTLQELWSAIERKPILIKYQLALTVCKKEKFNKGQNPYQDAQRLINLRNALAHYKSEWNTDPKVHKNLKSHLSNCFPVSPFSHVNDPFFPKKCIGHGCASWAVKTAVNFIEEFYKRLGIHKAFLPNDNLSTE